MAVTNYKAGDLQSYLQRLKQVKIANGTLNADGTQVDPSWMDSTPDVMAYQKPVDTGLLTAANNEIAAKDALVTGTVATQAQNYQNKVLYQQQQQLLRQAQKNAVAKLTPQQIKAAAKKAGTPNLQLSGGAPGAATIPVPSGGSVKGAPRPGAETTITSHGHTVTVNSAVAGRFKGFLDALWQKGYHFKSVGGYANRTQRGAGAQAGVMSLHSIGYAIDIDPVSNPTVPISSSGKYVYSLPPNVGALAAKYGLEWGGNWHNSKDFMHFSVPYGGRE